MGLDMYLKAQKYVSKMNYETEPPSNYPDYNKIASLYPELDTDNIYGYEISRTIAYWRKANQIHQWFVDNCQDGEDDCKLYYVDRPQLEELLNLCKQVKANQGKAEDLLPPQAGFFFGSTDIDDYYWADIDDTIVQLSAILENEKLKEYDFYYQSSW